MWLLISPAQRDDVPYWRGRRWWAALDAAVWPALLISLTFHLPGRFGLLGPSLISLALLLTIRRVHRALCRNHRYRFTAFFCFKVATLLLAFGEILKLLLGL